MCLAGGPTWEVGPKFDATFQRVALLTCVDPLI